MPRTPIYNSGAAAAKSSEPLWGGGQAGPDWGVSASSPPPPPSADTAASVAAAAKAQLKKQKAAKEQEVKASVNAARARDVKNASQSSASASYKPFGGVGGGEQSPFYAPPSSSLSHAPPPQPAPHMLASDAQSGYFEDPGIGFGAAQARVNGGYDNFGAFGGGMPPVSSFLGGMPQQQQKASAGNLDWDVPGVGQVGGRGGLWSGEGVGGGFAGDMQSSSAFGGQQQQQQQANFEVDQNIANFLPYGDYM